MTVSMKDVRAALDPDEPNYDEAARLGPEALPHLDALVSSGDVMLATKATFLASLIKDAKAVEIVRKAAQSEAPAMRVAAAVAASNLTASGASDVLVDLVADPDPGVRKVARKAVPEKPSAKLTEQLKAAPEPLGETTAPRERVHVVTGVMPGETGGGMPGSSGATMPGEQSRPMPGEQQKMPGE
jgi:hypothetical protein